MSVSLRSVVYCQVEISASGRSLIQMIPTECGVSECEQVSLKLQWVSRKWSRLRKEERISFSCLFIYFLFTFQLTALSVADCKAVIDRTVIPLDATSFILVEIYGRCGETRFLKLQAHSSKTFINLYQTTQRHLQNYNIIYGNGLEDFKRQLIWLVCQLHAETTCS